MKCWWPLLLILMGRAFAASTPLISNAYPPVITGYYLFGFAPIGFSQLTSIMPFDGYTGYVVDGSSCIVGTPVVGGGSTRCLITYNSTLAAWYPLAGASGGGIVPPIGDICGTASAPTICGMEGLALASPTIANGVYVVNPTNTSWQLDTVYTSAPYDVGFAISGVPGTSLVIPYTCTRTLNFPANFASSTFPDTTSQASCGVSPSETDTYIIKVNGVTIGTVGLSTSCVQSFATTGAATQICAAGQRLELDGPATVSGANIGITLAAHSP